MIDKTDSKIELMLEAIINRVKLYLGIFDRRLKEFKSLTDRHKILTRTIIGLIFILVVTGLALYRFIPREVTLIVDDSSTVISTSRQTQSRTVEAFLLERGYQVHPLDEVSPSLDETITNDMTINFNMSFDVAITADGQTKKLKTPTCTTLEALEKANIEIGEDDIVIPALDKKLRSGDNIVVKRVKIRYIKKIEKVPYKTKTIRTDQLRIGKHGVVTKGKNGKARNYYKLVYVDGKLQKTKLYKQEILKKPRTKVLGYGTRISFDGPPAGLSYRKVIKCRAVSYYFPGNPYGAGGRPCTYGTMAVDTRVIPMGTRCYVDGYGYAIANDVGGGIRGNEVDLYMEAFFQCGIWGARWANVYILD